MWVKDYSPEQKWFGSIPKANPSSQKLGTRSPQYTDLAAVLHLLPSPTFPGVTNLQVQIFLIILDKSMNFSSPSNPGPTSGRSFQVLSEQMGKGLDATVVPFNGAHPPYTQILFHGPFTLCFSDNSAQRQSGARTPFFSFTKQETRSSHCLYWREGAQLLKLTKSCSYQLPAGLDLMVYRAKNLG